MLEKNDVLPVCTEILEALRKGTILYEFFIGLLRKYAKDYGFTLEEIGTSESELESLNAHCCLIGVKGILNTLRTSVCVSSSEIDRLRKEINKGKLTLDQVGTTEDELEMFRVKGCKYRAERSLRFLRDGMSIKVLEAEILAQEITDGNLAFAEIGTSAKELVALVR